MDNLPFNAPPVALLLLVIYYNKYIFVAKHFFQQWTFSLFPANCRGREKERKIFLQPVEI
jgi:hypothetical protein